MSWGPEDEDRQEAEELEAEVIAEELAGRSLRDVAAEWLDGGDTVTVTVRGRSIAGVVVHAGEDFLTLRSRSGDNDLRFGAIASLVADPKRQGPPTSRSMHPMRFSGRLREVQASGERVALGGPHLEVEQLIIAVVAADHLLAECRGRPLVVPIAAIDSMLRPPVANRS